MGGEYSQLKASKGSDVSLPKPSHWWHQKLQPWSFVASIPTSKWKPEVGDLWGFDLLDEWKTKNFKVHKNPWSKFSVHSKSLMGKEEKICSFKCEVHKTGREEKIGVWLKDLSVIAYDPQVVVVQVVLSKAVKLLVVDWHHGHLLGTYSFAYSKEPCIQECFLSPDASLMLCRQNFLLRRRLNHVTNFDANIRVIEIKDGLCRRLFVIEDNLAYNAFGSGISFDPRFPSGRVTVFGSNLQAMSRLAGQEENLEGIQVYSLKKRQLVQSSPSQASRAIHHIRHSSDGALIAAVCVNISVYINLRVTLDSIQLYSTSNFDLLHTIAVPLASLKGANVEIYPLFSRDSGLLAQVTGDKCDQVHIYQLPVQVNNLQEFCRLAILRCTPLRCVGLLPLPTRLLDFLRYTQPEE